MDQPELLSRKATAEDADLLFEWVNDETVRLFSYQTEPVKYADHIKWFEKRVNNPLFYFVIFYTEGGKNAGLVRIEIKDNDAVIGILIDKDFRGKKLSPSMLVEASKIFFKNHTTPITAYIKHNNIASVKAFEKAGFVMKDNCIIEGSPSFKMIKND